MFFYYSIFNSILVIGKENCSNKLESWKQAKLILKSQDENNELRLKVLPTCDKRGPEGMNYPQPQEGI